MECVGVVCVSCLQTDHRQVLGVVIVLTVGSPQEVRNKVLRFSSDLRGKWIMMIINMMMIMVIIMMMILILMMMM